MALAQSASKCSCLARHVPFRAQPLVGRALPVVAPIRPARAAWDEQQRLGQCLRTHARKRKESGAMEATLDDDLEADDVLYGGRVADEEGFDGVIEEDEEAEMGGLEDLDEDELVLDEGEGELDWDQALTNFPTEQDEVDLTPTPAEAKLDAALKLVRAGELSEGVEVEVEDVVEEERVMPKTFKDQLAGLSVRDQETLINNRQGYLVFEMHGMELLVAQTADDKLDLSDAFLLDGDSQMYSRLDVGPGVPKGAVKYLAMPWEVEYPGDVSKFQETEYRRLRMYFSPVIKDGEEGINFQVSLDALYCFDTQGRALQQVPIIRLGKDIRDPVLRIREDAVYLQEASEMPHWIDVAEGYGDPADPESQQQLEIQGDEEVATMEERLEELELMEELDDVPDVPAVDLV